MALVNSAFTVNVTPGAMPPTVHVSEYDIGRTYTVTINGQNGSAFNIPTGTTATVEGTLNGVIGFTTGATISGSNVSFTLTESMTARSGKAWCKIKLTLNDEPIQTCAFILDVDRAGVEAETVIGAPGFEEQIVNAVNDWLDEHPPASGGMSEAFKQALLDCFEHVAWIDADGQDYYDALYAALYPPKTLVSISAAFNQGTAVIYETDSLDTLKQYLTVTATYDDTSTGVVTNYTLSGTLTEGTSTITVSYGGKTTTFDVTVAGLDEGVIYQIRNTSYSGEQSSTVTDVFPLTADSNYLIVADFTAGDSQGNNSYILSLLSEDSTYGVRIDLVGGRLRFWTTSQASETSIFETGSYIVAGRRYKVAYLHYAGTNYVSFAYTYVSATNIGGISVIPGQVFTTNNPIYAVGGGFSGTVHELTFYNDFGNPMDKITPVLSPESKLALWEVGAMSGSTGGMLDSTTRARTLFFLDTAITSIVLSSGYEMLLYAWNAQTGAYIGAWNGSGFGTNASYASSINFASIKSQYPQYNYRVLLRKSNNGTITAQEAYSNVTFS